MYNYMLHVFPCMPFRKCSCRASGENFPKYSIMLFCRAASIKVICKRIGVFAAMPLGCIGFTLEFTLLKD